MTKSIYHIQYLLFELQDYKHCFLVLHTNHRYGSDIEARGLRTPTNLFYRRLRNRLRVVQETFTQLAIVPFPNLT